MRVLLIAISILSLTACGSFNPEKNGAISNLGNGMYTISELGVFNGNLAEYAARHCAAMGQKMSIEGNTTARSFLSDDRYPVLIFRCNN